MQTENVRRVITALYEFYMAKPDALNTASQSKDGNTDSIERRVLDYIAGMTDRFAIEAYKTFLLPHNNGIAHSIGPDGALIP